MTLYDQVTCPNCNNILNVSLNVNTNEIIGSCPEVWVKCSCRTNILVSHIKSFNPNASEYVGNTR